MDAKAAVHIGNYSRGGTNRVPVEAADHDFHPEARVTPVGIVVPHAGDLALYAVTSKVTSDCLVDIVEAWWQAHRDRYAGVTTLLLNLDNGPESHSRRTQFMLRLLNFVRQSGLTLQLAYYPPYHSKYNPIERCWGILENHWNGDVLDTVDTVVQFARSMTWKGRQPTVDLITKTYQTGVSLSQEAMAKLETQIRRLPELGKWFVEIRPGDLLDGTIIQS